MVLDLMHRLIDVRSEDEVIQQGLDLCTLLFAPESAVFHGHAQAGELPDTSWSPDGRGFRLRVRRGEADFGVLEVQGVAFPESKGRYLAMAVTIGGIMALAISNARAYQALEAEKDLTEAATCAKSDFLSSMSHEIRTPMNGVVGMVELLLTTDLSTQQRQYAELAQTSGRTLLALIDDILDLSKVEAGKVTLEALDFDLRSTLSNATSMLGVRAHAKGVALIGRIAPEVPGLVRGDANRLRQVLINLVGNAIKFTERGEIAVQLTLDHETDGRSTVRFAVIDTGIGIPQERIAALFSPFVQAKASTTRKYGGTGLGLAISQRLVELMGGKIGVESREGVGSTFWFTVAFGRPEPSSSRQPELVGERSAACLPAAGRAPSRRPPRILVAEDDPTNQTVVLAQLSKLGFMADMAGTGAEAIRALEAGEYDLILMDCHMPEMDGYEATRRIRASGKPDIPIIALTADAMQGHYGRCLREGMNDFVSKPVELQQLSDVLAKWLRGDCAPNPIQCAAVATGEAAPVFDEGGFLGRLMNDRSLARTVLDGFLQDCPVQIALLSDRLAEADAPGARRQAHKLKGAAACVSAESLRALGLEMERAATANDLDRVGALLPRATEAFERLKITLQMAGWLGQDLNSELQHENVNR
jgi:signal transduction histidine kinase/CheY-like chemotaxis protein/HPt (histidine-containing phosphotransfer) domain-containing protein